MYAALGVFSWTYTFFWVAVRMGFDHALWLLLSTLSGIVLWSCIAG